MWASRETSGLKEALYCEGTTCSAVSLDPRARNRHCIDGNIADEQPADIIYVLPASFVWTAGCPEGWDIVGVESNRWNVAVDLELDRRVQGA